MNLYDLHPKPKEAPGYEKRFQVPSIAYEYAATKSRDKHGKPKRSPELEPAIAKDPKYAYWYARDILERFPEGEPAIAKDSKWAWLYAANVLKGRFLLGEPAIAKDSYYKRDYEAYFGVGI